MKPADAIRIRRLDGTGLPQSIAAQVDAIFFDASGRTAFASAEERAAFRERWLGRYLAGGSDVVLIAEDGDGAVAGYLVGATEDPAAQARFADLDYFRVAFRDLCRRYPAHLHVNLAAPYRNRGVGGRLIAAFAAAAAEAGAAGMHVVTARAARNVAFYARCGFAALRVASWNGREVVFLGQPLPLRPPG